MPDSSQSFENTNTWRKRVNMILQIFTRSMNCKYSFPMSRCCCQCRCCQYRRSRLPRCCQPAWLAGTQCCQLHGSLHWYTQHCQSSLLQLSQCCQLTLLRLSRCCQFNASPFFTLCYVGAADIPKGLGVSESPD
jgi:hypothetical protein